MTERGKQRKGQRRRKEQREREITQALTPVLGDLTVSIRVLIPTRFIFTILTSFLTPAILFQLPASHTVETVFSAMCYSIPAIVVAEFSKGLPWQRGIL